MFKIQLNKRFFAFVTFDGMVPEFFSADSEKSSRYHVGMIKSIEVTADKKGNHHLKMNTNKVSLDQELDQEVVNEVRGMVSEVQKAMKTYHG
jgi:hypothetical protein